MVAYEGTLEDVTAEVEGRREEQALVREHRGRLIWATDDWLAGYCSCLLGARAQQ